MKTKINVGDLVSSRAHIAQTKHGKMLISEPALGVVIGNNGGSGYYDIVLNTGKIICTSYANLEVVNA